MDPPTEGISEGVPLVGSTSLGKLNCNVCHNYLYDFADEEEPHVESERSGKT